MTSQTWFLLEETAIPLIVASVIVLGRKAPYRTIQLLSVCALVLVGVKWVLFAIEYSRGAFRPDGYLQYPLEPSLVTLDTIRNAILTFALFLGIAAWILALHNAVSQRRWRWFWGILAGAVFSYVISAIDISLVFMRGNTLFDQLVRTHFLATFIVLGSFAHLTALVTLLYALAVRAPRNRLGEPMDDEPERSSTLAPSPLGVAEQRITNANSLLTWD